MIVFKIDVKYGPSYTVVMRDWAALLRHLADDYEQGNVNQLMAKGRLRVRAVGQVWNESDWVPRDV